MKLIALLLLAAAAPYFLPLDGIRARVPSGWRVVACHNAHSWPEDAVICARGSSEASAWLRKQRETRRCALGSEQKEASTRPNVHRACIIAPEGAH